MDVICVIMDVNGYGRKPFCSMMQNGFDSSG